MLRTLPTPRRRAPLLSVALAALLVAGTALTATAQSPAASAVPVTPSAPAGPATPPAPVRALDLSPFQDAIAALTPERRAELDTLVIEGTFADLGAAMAGGTLTSVELTTYYLARIQELDVNGFQSMNELNPEALTIAAALDAERAAGTVRGPLHGIPLSLKDNIGTGDQLHTTAGAAALEDAKADRDSAVAAKLRAAGAVILGKANMSEWAGLAYPTQPGFSVLGGQTINPIDATRSPDGSSSGSAVGTSANLVAGSIGTETLGSLVAPAATNGVVGMHPSLGLVSRDRVIPLTDQTDTPGPLARTVTDAAILLTAIAGSDPNDPMTADAAALDGTDFTTFLDKDALKGKRVGIFTTVPKPADFPDVVPPEGVAAVLKQLGLDGGAAGLTAAGAEVVLVWGPMPATDADLFEVIRNGFRLGLPTYMAATDPSFPIQTLADLIAFNDQDPARYAPYGQASLAQTAATALSPEDYAALGAKVRTATRAWLDGVMADQQLDVIVAPNQTLASAYAPAGYPAITVPVAPGLGFTFTTGHLKDGEAIGMAYAFEQATNGRAALVSGK